jgi:glutaconate CoA-transferase subunit B
MTSTMERLTVWMARCLRDGDVAVVGVGTPVALAAVLLARVTHAPRLRIMMPGALDPVHARVDKYLGNPAAAVAGAAARLSRLDILDAIAAGEVTVQFVRPAQVDAQLRLNTELLATPSGPLHLVGPVALPDVVERVGRVIAYLPTHDTTTLVTSVDAVTAPRGRTGRTVSSVVTPLAQLSLASGRAVVTARAADTSMAEIRARTGFPLDVGERPVLAEPAAEELAALRTAVDPLRLVGLEDPRCRDDARRTLAELWSSADTRHRPLEAAP